jgi:limonene-1,2-epoxide hydrolase
MIDTEALLAEIAQSENSSDHPGYGKRAFRLLRQAAGAIRQLQERVDSEHTKYMLAEERVTRLLQDQAELRDAEVDDGR